MEAQNMKNQIYHEDIPKQDADTIFQELKNTKAQLQEIQADLGRIENVLFELKHLKNENERYIHYLFTGDRQPIEVRVFYELAYKYDVFKEYQLNEKNIFKQYNALYSRLSSDRINIMSYEQTLIQFYFCNDED